MKRILTLLLAVCIVFCLASCGKGISHEDFMAAEAGEEVTVEAYVQAKQSWWDNKAVFYLQNEEGGFYVYNLPCTKAEYDELEIGTKVRVIGTKAVYNGMHEIFPAESFEILRGNWVADATDITSKIGNNDELTKYQGMLATLSDMTVVSVEYNNEGGDDIYLTVAKGEVQHTLTVEVYLTGTDTEVYQTVGTLVAGDVVDVTGFVQWWNKFDMHITAVAK